MRNETYGDTGLAECPACGGILRDLTDLADGLREGEEFECKHCGAEITIQSIDISVTLSAEKEGEE